MEWSLPPWVSSVPFVSFGFHNGDVPGVIVYLIARRKMECLLFSVGEIVIPFCLSAFDLRNSYMNVRTRSITKNYIPRNLAHEKTYYIKYHLSCNIVTRRYNSNALEKIAPVSNQKSGILLINVPARWKQINRTTNRPSVAIISDIRQRVVCASSTITQPFHREPLCTEAKFIWRGCFANTPEGRG